MTLFENPVCCKISKKLKGGPFGVIKKIRKNFQKTKNANFETVSQCRKTRKEGPFGLFETSICCKILKTWRGTLWRQKKSRKIRTVPKKLKGGPCSPIGFYIFLKQREICSHTAFSMIQNPVYESQLGFC